MSIGELNLVSHVQVKTSQCSLLFRTLSAFLTQVNSQWLNPWIEDG
jgi:hypothetical protein